jgi:hypothetical protein
VKLRDHPLMTRKSGMKAWPPIWLNVNDSRDKPKGEIGILTRVLSTNAVSNGLFVWVEHRGFQYVGALYFDDVAFCRAIESVLQSKIGTSIDEIGNVDLSYTL